MRVQAVRLRTSRAQINKKATEVAKSTVGIHPRVFAVGAVTMHIPHPAFDRLSVWRWLLRTYDLTIPFAGAVEESCFGKKRLTLSVRLRINTATASQF